MKPYTRKHRDRCQESAEFQSPGLKIDKAKGIVYGVKFLGLKSYKYHEGQRELSREYEDSAVAEALPLYEGAVVNLDHSKVTSTDLNPSEVPVQRRFGRLRNVRHAPGDGGYGNLHYNPKHPWAGAFEHFVEHDPEAIGLSHDAVLQGPYRADGVRSIRKIPKVFSVDVVTSPGTTKSMFEDSSPEEPTPTGAAIDMSDLEDEDDEGPDEATEHLCNYVCSVMKSDDETSVKRSKILAAVDLLFKGEEAGDEEESEEEEDETPDPEPESKMSKDTESSAPTLESVQAENAALRVELDKFRATESLNKAKAEARALCEKASLPKQLITDVFIDSMVSRGQESWEDMVADRRVQANSSEKPKSAPHGTSGETVDDWVNQYRSTSIEVAS